MEQQGQRDPTVEALEQRLGVPVVNPDVALAALTHKSFVNEHRGEGLCDNERLEFLGDAVIDLAVSHRLMERFPEAREGELSKIRAAVVDEAGLALIARELDLGALLRLGRGEELTGGRQKSSLLADALEAVIAALYLAGGLEPVLCVIDRFLGDAFARAAAGTLDRDFKTQFQELAQSRLRSSPRYRVVAEHGPDHSKVFDVELEVRGEVIGRGAGRSKKDAEQAAAKLALEAMNGRFGAVEAAGAEGAADAAPPVLVAVAAAAVVAPGQESALASPDVLGDAAPPAPSPEPAPPEEAPAAARPPRKRKPKVAPSPRPRRASSAKVAPGRAATTGKRAAPKRVARARVRKPAKK
jgi:ribonuclease III